MNKFTLAIASCLVLSACASAPTKSTSQTAPQSTVQSKDQTGALSQSELDARKLAEQIQSLKNKSVYFDFDKSSINPEYRDVVQQQADFLKAHGNDSVTLEGNCDERGSSEYNLALGDRRANAVRKELESLGVFATQIKTVSFGEEKPRLTCHEEKCWKENRRVDFNHQLSH